MAVVAVVKVFVIVVVEKIVEDLVVVVEARKNH